MGRIEGTQLHFGICRTSPSSSLYSEPKYGQQYPSRGLSHQLARSPYIVVPASSSKTDLQLCTTAKPGKEETPLGCCDRGGNSQTKSARLRPHPCVPATLTVTLSGQLSPNSRKTFQLNSSAVVLLYSRLTSKVLCAQTSTIASSLSSPYVSASTW